MKTTRTILIWIMALAIVACSKDGGPGENPAPNNNAPVANAGPNQKVEIGNTVNLNAADSEDPDGDEITYKWAIQTKPSGSMAEITGSTAMQATFPLDKAGVYEIELTVSDGESNATDIIVVTNKTPVINSVDGFENDFPAFTEGKLERRGSELDISAAYLSEDLSEVKVTLNGEDCEFESYNPGELEVEIPENATSGELVLTVGEEQAIYDNTVFIFSEPIETLTELPIFDDRRFESTSLQNYEIGIIFKPLKDGKILGFKIGLQTSENVDYSIWDMEGNLLAEGQQDDADFNDIAFENPLEVVAATEYILSFNHNEWYRNTSSSTSNIFPQVLHNEIEITGYANEPAASRTFPDDTVMREGEAILTGVDIVFVADLEN